MECTSMAGVMEMARLSSHISTDTEVRNNETISNVPNRNKTQSPAPATAEDIPLDNELQYFSEKRVHIDRMKQTKHKSGFRIPNLKHNPPDDRELYETSVITRC